MKVPKSIYANGLYNIFTNKKKYRIECGACGHVWDDKVPMYVDRASSVCPCCGEQNVWSHSAFDAYYERTMRIIRKERG
jgi:rRNA maturation endonuclease Nob1